MIRVLRFAAILLLFTCIVSAQSQKESAISSTAELVTVPVVVTDSTGKAIRGMKQENFKIQENGKEQRIATFEEVGATRRTIRSVTQQNGIYTNRVNNDNAVSLGILVVDFVNTRAVNQYWAIRGALSFLDKWKGKGGFNQPMMMAAITREGLRIIHQATSDPAVLETAMQFVKSAPSPGRENQQGTLLTAADPPRNADGTPIVPGGPESRVGPSYEDRVTAARQEAQQIDQMERANQVIRQAAVNADTRTTMWALQALANGVAGIPGRKAMIWSSEVFPFQSVQEVFGSPEWTKAHGSTDEDPELKPLRDATLLALNRANISVYPVNAAGLLTPEYFDASWADRKLMTGAQWSTMVNRTSEGEMDNKQNARIVADETGGRPCMNTNDIADCLGRALDDSSHYYMLTYYPDPKPKGAGWRKIKVDVKGEKISVRARNSYFYGTVPTYGTAGKSEVAVALQSNLDYTALPIVLKFIGMKPAEGGKRIVEFVVGVDGRALSIDEEHGNRISLLIGAQAKAGDAPAVVSIDTKLKPELVEQIRAKQLTHNGEMQLTLGKYDVRVVVRDNLTGRIGSVVAPIEVQ
jgi:VWFA-related protein